MTAVVLRGDARRLPLPDASVDLIMTSPPYFGLRSYADGGEHHGAVMRIVMRPVKTWRLWITVAVVLIVILIMVKVLEAG